MNTFKREVCEQLGNLFYSLAQDMHVQALEDGIIKQIITLNPIPTAGSTQGISAGTHEILFTLDALESEKANADAAYDRFAAYFLKNLYLFTPELRKWTKEIAEQINSVLPTRADSNKKHTHSLMELLTSELTSHAE